MQTTIEPLISEEEAIGLLGMADLPLDFAKKKLRNLCRNKRLVRATIHRSIYCFTSAELRRFIAENTARKGV